MISVIVPVYHGEKYISRLLSYVEAAADRIPGQRVEILFVNDDPASPINMALVSDIVKVDVINTDVNRGIHGARVKGLLRSKGEFILFLDQDDKIHPDFLEKQLQRIGDADAVVCNVLHDGHIYYNIDRPFEWAVKQETMLFKQNMILSPGQVLIRREAIPSVWTEKIMGMAGADDWFLWVCMLCMGKKFAVNEAVLFEHRLHYGNTSMDSTRMADSENEAVKIIEESGLLQGGELDKVKNMIRNVQRKRIEDSEKCKRMFRVLSDWMSVWESGRRIADSLIRKGIHNAAIYGYGHFGRHLLAELRTGNIEVSYIIDRNAKYIDVDIVRKTLDDDLENVDAVIVALLKNGNDTVLERNIMQKINTQIFWLTDIISEMMV